MSVLKVSAMAAVVGVASAALLAIGGAATAQDSPYRQAAPYYETGPFTADGTVIVNGEIVGRDPDQRIRSSLLRENGGLHGD